MGLMELQQYLKERVAPSTSKRYLREIELFSQNVSNPVLVGYDEIMNYLGYLRDKGKNKVIRCELAAIKCYYDYLLATGQRSDHPAKSIILRDNRNRDVQLQDLFTPKELETVLEKSERYLILKNRNRVILSLLIYQGLTTGEIVRLRLNHLDLEEGTICVEAGRKTNGRTLKLVGKQVYWLMSYLNVDRVKLLKIKSENLIISMLGKPETGEGINYVVETRKHLFAQRNLNPTTIRQSVITNLLKDGKDLRVVQAFAGHKYPSTTERYKQTHVEELKEQILKYHPLG